MYSQEINEKNFLQIDIYPLSLQLIASLDVQQETASALNTIRYIHSSNSIKEQNRFDKHIYLVFFYKK